MRFQLLHLFIIIKLATNLCHEIHILLQSSLNESGQNESVNFAEFNVIVETQY